MASVSTKAALLDEQVGHRALAAADAPGQADDEGAHLQASTSFFCRRRPPQR
jgi:hypothetical protein